MGAAAASPAGRWPSSCATGSSSKLGAEQDAYFLVDPIGVEFAGGGLHMTLRDLARFGETMRLGGRFNGAADRAEGVRGRRHAAAATASASPAPATRCCRAGAIAACGGCSHNAHGAFAARGIHGQAIYVDPAAEMVIARFASHPLGANANLDPTSLPAFAAVARRLMEKP